VSEFDDPSDGAVASLRSGTKAGATGDPIPSSLVASRGSDGETAAKAPAAETRPRLRERAREGETAAFQPGTRIQTSGGETAVEGIEPGSLLIAHPQGSVRALAVDTRGAFSRSGLIRIVRGAFKADLPTNDLLLHPDQCIYWDGTLIPARLLLQVTTIRHEAVAQTGPVEIVLSEPSVVLAEGLWVSSWHNTDQRGYYVVGGALMLNAGFSEAASATITGPIVTALNRDLARRSLAVRLPALWVQTNERTAKGTRDGSRFVFVVKPSGSGLTLVSGQAVLGDRPEFPAAVKERVGVAISRIVATSGDEVREIPMDHPGLIDGFRDCEWRDQRPFRWTTGTARIPADLLTGLGSPVQIDVEILQTW
jgi:Hint domain